MIMKSIQKYWEEKPLTLIMWLAIIARLIAVVFARGWGMLDDHFLVIEVSQSWADGGDISKWLPSTTGNNGPTGHSLFYPGLHFLLFKFFNFLHLTNPQIKMLLVRLIHAAFSLIIVYLGYRIAEKISDRKTARITGLLLAVYWFMPWLSVRNLVEFFAVPFLFIGVWLIINARCKKKYFIQFALSGFITGLALSVRYQTIIFAGGMCLVLLFEKRWKETLYFGFSYLLSVSIIQGGIDIFIWGRPFAEITEYVRYNIDNAYNYITGGFFNYLLFIILLLIPPISLFLFFGFFRKWRKHFIIFLPTLLFLLFHSFFPNKQERFILTIVPFVILLGIVGWYDFLKKSQYWEGRTRLMNACWMLFWIINLILLPVVSTMYSKKARAESMTYLSEYDNVKSLLVEDSNKWGVDILPQFYLGQWVNVYEISKEKPINSLPENILDKAHEPRFILFFNENNLESRVENLKVVFPELEYETTIRPGFVDELMYWLNPFNKNESIIIYRNGKYF